MKMFVLNAAKLLLILFVAIACNKKSDTFSLLASKASFTQNSTESGKVDILFVVDNSGSMLPSQQSLTTNFNNFMTSFTQKGFDYQLAVTTSDSYLANFGSPASVAKFKDGTDTTSHTGVYVINSLTVNPVNIFSVNAVQGTSGSNDERTFSSFQTALNSSLNLGFLRQNAFLAIVIVSDEDDFSHDGSNSIAGQYSNTALHQVSNYITYLNNLTSSTSTNKRYSVNAMTIMDQACLEQLGGTNAAIRAQKIGYRHMDIADQTGGVKASLCGDFATGLNAISQKIVELQTRFCVDQDPILSTLVVTVNNIAVSQSSTNGYTYDSSNRCISFHGTSIPPKGANISVSFDPSSLK